MRKKIWGVTLCATFIFFVAAFLGCQSQDDPTGPVALEGDMDPGIEGNTMLWDPEGETIPGCYMRAWDLTVEPDEMFWYGNSNEAGYYAIGWWYLKYREGHLIKIEAWKLGEGLYGFQNVTYRNPPMYVYVTLYPE